MIVSLSGCQYVCAFADPTDSLTRPWHVYLFILSMPIYTHSPLSKHIYTRTRQKNSVSPYYHCVHLSMHTHNTVQCRMYVSSYLSMPGAVWKSASFFTMACTFRMELLSYRNTYSKGERGAERG